MSAMVPDPNWGSAAHEFDKQMGHQVTLCAVCIDQLGDTTPPPVVVIQDGTSYCLPHRPPLRYGTR